MKRLLVCAGLLAATALPAAGAAGSRAATAAGTRGFHGTANPDGTVGFRAKIRDGKPVKVMGSRSHRGFAWEDVPIECDRGNVRGGEVSGYFRLPIKVRHRRFHAKGSDGYTTARVRGRFRNHGRRARGTVRLHGDFPRFNASGCDTGRAHWRAHRLPA